MAIQDDLAAALGAISAATNKVSTIGDQATAAIAAVTAAYTARINTLRGTYHVNAITGSDANPGTQSAPLRGIQAALDKTPVGGQCYVLLQSDIALGANILVQGKFLSVASYNSVRYKIQPGVGLNNSSNPAPRVCYGFRLAGQAAVVLFNVGLVVPPLGGYGSNPDYNSAQIFNYTSSVELAPQQVSIMSCDIDIPVTSFGALIQNGWAVGLQMIDIALIGATTSLNGRVVAGTTSSAGTATTTQTQLLTNLTTI